MSTDQSVRQQKEKTPSADEECRQLQSGSVLVDDQYCPLLMIKVLNQVSMFSVRLL